MASEIKPTSRAENPTFPNGRGVVSVKKIEVNNSGTITVSIPAKSRHFVVKNIGNQDIELWFNSDPSTDFYVLFKNETTPIIDIIDTTVIHLKTKSSKSDVNILLWG